MVGKQHDGFLPGGDGNFDAAQGVFLPVPVAAQADDLVAADVSLLRQGSRVPDPIAGVATQAGDEEHPLAGPAEFPDAIACLRRPPIRHRSRARTGPVRVGKTAWRRTAPNK